jgi:phage/plasmid-associated DNA primase
LNNVTLRQLTGGNNLTAARKHQGEVIFKFKGQIVLLCNGLWCPEEAFIGSDKRRHAGLTFAIKFVDNPKTLNELEKNTNIKQHITQCFAEFWFLARVFWLLPKPRPGSDRTTPICPNSESLAKALMNESEGGCHELAKDAVEKFVKERLEVYTTKLAPPAGFTTIEAAFKQWLEPAVVDQEVLRQAMRTVLMFKPAVTIAKFGTRKKTSVNAYTKNNEIMTLKSKEQLELERTLKTAADAAAATSSSGV